MGDVDLLDLLVEAEQEGSPIPGVAIAIVEGGDIIHSKEFGSDGRSHAVTPERLVWRIQSPTVTYVDLDLVTPVLLRLSLGEYSITV